MKVMKLMAILVAVGLLSVSADADILLRTAKYIPGTYGYGGSSWSQMSGMLDAASGNSITPVVDLSNASQVSSADALWVDLGPVNGDPGLLSASEIANIQGFVAAGKRVVLIGENSNWSSWNAQITGLLGGSSTTANTSGLATSVISHELTVGVSTVDIPTGGTTVGGAALFSQSVAALYGPSANALVILDVNMFDGSINNQDNAAFAQNVANWVAIPEPASMAMLGIVGIGGWFTRRRLVM